MSAPSSTGPASRHEEWSASAFSLLRERGYTLFAYVPDSGHRPMIDLAWADDGAVAIPLTAEEEGVAICAGAHLGGGRGVLLIQSSGVGNCTNFLSLIRHCGFPFLTLVTMRGDYGEQNPWQYAMGRAVEPVFAALDVITRRVDAAESVVPVLEATIGMVERGERAVAVLLTQTLLGVKAF